MTFTQAYLVLFDPEPFNNVPFFKLVMFAGVCVAVSALWGIYARFENRVSGDQKLPLHHRRVQDGQHQQHVMRAPLLGEDNGDV